MLSESIAGISESVHDISVHVKLSPNEGSGESVYMDMHRLARAFTARIPKVYMLLKDHAIYTSNSAAHDRIGRGYAISTKSRVLSQAATIGITRGTNKSIKQIMQFLRCALH